MNLNFDRIKIDARGQASSTVWRRIVRKKNKSRGGAWVRVCVNYYRFLNGTLVMQRKTETKTDTQKVLPTMSSLKYNSVRSHFATIELRIGMLPSPAKHVWEFLKCMLKHILSFKKVFFNRYLRGLFTLASYRL